MIKPEQVERNKTAQRKKGNIVLSDLPNEVWRVMLHSPKVVQVDDLDYCSSTGIGCPGEVLCGDYFSVRDIEVAIVLQQLDALLELLGPWQKACRATEQKLVLTTQERNKVVLTEIGASLQGRMPPMDTGSEHRYLVVRHVFLPQHGIIFVDVGTEGNPQYFIALKKEKEEILISFFLLKYGYQDALKDNAESCSS